MSFYISKSGITVFTNHPLTTQRLKMMANEKLANVQFFQVGVDISKEAYLEFNPYGSEFALIDQDIMITDLYSAIMYIEERYPALSLFPNEAIDRARLKQILLEIIREWDQLVCDAENNKSSTQKNSIKELTERLIQFSPVFEATDYFMHSELNVIDIFLSGILLRAKAFNIELPKDIAGINRYTERLFERKSFMESVSDIEMEYLFLENW